MKRNRGNVLILVAFLGLLISGALLSVTFLTRTDLSTNENLLQEILATNLAESVAAQIESQVNTRPWSERFWLAVAQKAGKYDPEKGLLPLAVIDASSAQLDLSKDTLDGADYEIAGVVKDLPSTLREYRLYLEVKLRGEVYAFSWDKRWDLSLLAGMDRDNTQQDRVLEDPSGPDAVDDMLDALKAQAITAPPPGGASEEQHRNLVSLKDHEPNFKATAVPGGPGAGEPVAWPGEDGWEYDENDDWAGDPGNDEESGPDPASVGETPVTSATEEGAGP